MLRPARLLKLLKAASGGCLRVSVTSNQAT
jgi:hypothetical protein